MEAQKGVYEMEKYSTIKAMTNKIELKDKIKPNGITNNKLVKTPACGKWVFKKFF